jgi:hypothetical protein
MTLGNRTTVGSVQFSLVDGRGKQSHKHSALTIQRRGLLVLFTVCELPR